MIDKLPVDWQIAPLGEVCTPSREAINPSAYPNELFEYYSIPAFQETAHPATTPGRDILSQKLLVPDGTVLFGKLNPRVPKVWRVRSRTPYRKLASTEFLALLPSDRLDVGFLTFLCWSSHVMEVSKGLVGGSTPSRQRVDPSSFYQIRVPVPPPPEQRAIAGVLAKIQAAVEVQEKIVAALKELKAATMAKLFREGLQDQGAEPRRTRFGDVPADWVAVPLAEVAYIQTGVAKGRRIGDESATVELPYLRVANVQDGYLDLSEIKTIRLRETERRRYSLQSDDVLLTEGGDFDKLGRGYLWHGQIPECVHQNHIFAVRTSGGKLLPDFFAYLAQSPYGKAYFLSVAHKTTNLASINSTKLKGFPVLLPLLSEQRKIAMTLKKIDESIDLQATRLKTLKSAFSSMLHRLMTGRVRVTRKMIALQALEARRKRRPKWSSKVDEKVLKEVVRRIVEAVAPEKIILFGSAARGEMGPDSDLDLLVVKACENAREVARTIRRQLIGIGVPKDVVVVTPEDVEEYKDIPGYVIGPALKEGKVLYAA